MFWDPLFSWLAEPLGGQKCIRVRIVKHVDHGFSYVCTLQKQLSEPCKTVHHHDVRVAHKFVLLAPVQIS